VGLSPTVYVDDVVLFAKPKAHDLRAIREILRIFGGAATLIRCDEMDEALVGDFLRCRVPDSKATASNQKPVAATLGPGVT
jgi:hypothetical protein